MQDRHVSRDRIASHVKGVLMEYDVLASGWLGDTGYFYEIQAVVIGQVAREFFDLMGDEDIPALPDSDRSAAEAPTTPPERAASGEVATPFRDCPVCPELVVVPAGNFVIGSPAEEAERMHSEGPRHMVTLTYSLAVGVHEVTFQQWDACVNDGGCARYRPDDIRWGRRNRPVINVSWHDAKSYLEWLSRETGHRYRLLSESEWEYAARAGSSVPFTPGRRSPPSRQTTTGRTYTDQVSSE